VKSGAGPVAANPGRATVQMQKAALANPKTTETALFAVTP
jgi:hypothetical protein